MDENAKWGVGNSFAVDAFEEGHLENGEKYELIFGEHPHSRRDNNIYARFAGGKIEGFDGHRIQVEVKIKTYNYLKESGLSGNEVREGGRAELWMNGFQCYSFFFRDPQRALLKMHGMINTFKEHAVRLWDEKDRARLIGRKVYYHQTPAVITRFFEDQGAVWLEPEKGHRFPAPVWAEDEYERSEWRDGAKDDFLSPHIWWWREDKKP